MHWMAPETFKVATGGSPYSSKVDIWSLGVIAFMALTGKAPFVGQSKQAIRNAITR